MAKPHWHAARNSTTPPRSQHHLPPSNAMTTPIRIDFVSDIVCPWCAIGLRALEEAMQRLGEAVPVELHFQPFELNPDMPAAGENIDAPLMRKYAINTAEVAPNREQNPQPGEAHGFAVRSECRRER